jgi:hypothetical protein
MTTRRRDGEGAFCGILTNYIIEALGVRKSFRAGSGVIARLLSTVQDPDHL